MKPGARRRGELPVSPRSLGEFPVPIDRSSGTPLPVQLAAWVRDAIDAGTLRPGEPMPATREMSRRLGVARGVAVSAYEQLRAEGYLVSGHGRGTVVHPDLASIRADGPAPRAALHRALPDAGPGAGPRRARPLAPGVPITDAVDRPAWRAAWRTAVSRAHLAAPELGDPRLRQEIAEHLRRMRGTGREPSDVLVTAGAREGLGLLLTALGATRGHALVVGVEDPGYPSLRQVASRHGAQIVALPVDGDGLDTARLPDGLLDLLIVTPSHQYPLGGSLPLKRRRELIAWATRAGVVVVEDDFDSELRYSGSPLPTLAALDDPVGGVVVLLGTFSRTVAPGLSAGYLLAPEGLRSRIEPIRRELGGPVSTIVQEALAQYLASGELRRHTARMLRRYAARRDEVSERLAGLRGVRVRPMDGGLHAVIELTRSSGAAPRIREAAVVARSDRAGLGAEALSRYWQQRDAEAGIAGLVIGMGGSDDAEFGAALESLRSLLA